MVECVSISELPSSAVCGVYQIRNTKTGKVYIGSSNNIGRRWREHLSELRAGAHFNDRLQRDWGQFGEGAFRMEVVEECNEPALIHKERATIRRRKAHRPEHGYNSSDQPDRVGAKLTEADVVEMRRLRRETGLTYREIGERFGVTEGTASNAVTGRTWANVPGAVADSYGSSRSGEANPNASLTDEQVEKLRTETTHVGQVNGLAEELNVERSTVYNALTGKTYSQAPGVISFCASAMGEKCKSRQGWLGYVGERHHKAKLTADDVREMRRLRRATQTPFAKIGDMYGLTSRNARRAIQGLTWAHVTDVAPVLREEELG